MMEMRDQIKQSSPSEADGSAGSRFISAYCATLCMGQSSTQVEHLADTKVSQLEDACLEGERDDLVMMITYCSGRISFELPT